MTRHLSILLHISIACLLTGCGGPYGGSQDEQSQQPEDLLTNIKETLKEEKPTVATYHSVAHQLNSYLGRRPEIRDRLKLEAEERKIIAEQLLPGLVRDDRQRRIDALDGAVFAELDVYHLDACFLFRDAARAQVEAMGGAPDRNDPRYDEIRVQLAQNAFNWVARQVCLEPPPPDRDVWPPQEVLRRGAGSAEERALVFLALLEQLGLDGCMVARKVDAVTEEGQRETHERPWIPGILIGKEVYLFDTNLGLTIPGPGGKGIATLRQLRENASLLQDLGAKLTAAQLEKTAILVPCTLPALSPRMLWLQGELNKDKAENRVTLYQSLTAALRHFREAGLTEEVRPWTDRRGFPAVVLTRYVENPRHEPRLQTSIVPRQLVPDWVNQMASRPGPRQALRSQYFYSIFERVFLRVRHEAGGPRDFLVRGRPENAIESILADEKQLDRVSDAARLMPDSGKVIREMGRAHLELLEKEITNATQRRLVSGDQNLASREADKEIQELNMRYRGMLSQLREALLYQSFDWGAAELREHLTYFMGLAKMEQAVRAEQLAAKQPDRAAKDGELTPAQRWGSAADWFSRYQAIILPKPTNNWSTPVHFHLATCRAAQGRYQDAIAHLEQLRFNPSDDRKEIRYQDQTRARLIREYRQKQSGKKSGA